MAIDYMTREMAEEAWKNQYGPAKWKNPSDVYVESELPTPYYKHYNTKPAFPIICSKHGNISSSSSDCNCCHSRLYQPHYINDFSVEALYSEWKHAKSAGLKATDWFFKNRLPVYVSRAQFIGEMAVYEEGLAMEKKPQPGDFIKTINVQPSPGIYVNQNGDEFTINEYGNVVINKPAKKQKLVLELKRDGKLHCETGPAVVYDDGEKQWWQNGQLHREDGPAMVYADGQVEYFLNDKTYETKEEYYVACAIFKKNRASEARALIAQGRQIGKQQIATSMAEYETTRTMRFQDLKIDLPENFFEKISSNEKLFDHSILCIHSNNHLERVDEVIIKWAKQTKCDREFISVEKAANEVLKWAVWVGIMERDVRGLMNDYLSASDQKATQFTSSQKHSSAPKVIDAKFEDLQKNLSINLGKLNLESVLKNNIEAIMREGLSGFIGQPNDKATQKQMAQFVDNAFNTNIAIGNNKVTDYSSNISVVCKTDKEIEYCRQKFYDALKIPREYLGP